MNLCSAKDKEEFFKEYEHDLNFISEDPIDIDQKTV